MRKTLLYDLRLHVKFDFGDPFIFVIKRLQSRIFAMNFENMLTTRRDMQVATFGGIAGNSPFRERDKRTFSKIPFYGWSLICVIT